MDVCVPQAEEQTNAKADEAAVAEYDAEGKDALEELRVLAEKVRTRIWQP